jgi:hypothetical protein
MDISMEKVKLEKLSISGFILSIFVMQHTSKIIESDLRRVMII